MTTAFRLLSTLLLVLPAAALHPSGALGRLHRQRPRLVAPVLLEPPFPLPYDVPKQPKPFSDYEWDDDCAQTTQPPRPAVACPPWAEPGCLLNAAAARSPLAIARSPGHLQARQAQGEL